MNTIDYFREAIHMKMVNAVGRVATFLVILLALHSTCVWSQQTTGKAVSKGTPAPGPQWKSYVSEKYGFQFLYPPGGSVKKRDDINYKYIRVQNYDLWTLAPGLGPYGDDLKPNEFYLEVFIIDPALGHERWEPCEKAIKAPNTTRQGNIVVYTGTQDDPGGDPGGFREVLCAKLQGFDIWVQGTEGTQKKPTVKAILRSFKFTK
jgi:hypothetical protein